ncbi:CGNR zinc finger domain-containing protein [Microbacterium sp. A8/3-1]|uniref:CGNR zinc finger domain-containing protein n=1 Tax=Microbacterium sp. A8/3-1 TaxID=3160749 RepID=A0AAU7W122_9MICO
MICDRCPGPVLASSAIVLRPHPVSRAIWSRECPRRGAPSSGRTPAEIPPVCVGYDCSRVFIDISRNANRRWCGMRECGDKAKAKAYRARRKMAARPSTTSP